MADLLGFIGFKALTAHRKNSRSVYLLPFTFFAFCVFAAVDSPAQEMSVNTQEVKAVEHVASGNPEPSDVPANLAAPAVKIISKDEKDALARLSDVKDRTKLALELMDARIRKAESLVVEGNSYSATLNELGGFHALMDDTIRFLNSNNNGGGKVMSTFKRFEISLRAFMPRLEIIRRDMPERFAYHVRTLLVTVRDTRSKAVEPFFSTTVLPGDN